MNLVFDQGNTLTKFAVFDNDEIIKSGSFAELDDETARALPRDVDNVIVSSVGCRDKIEGLANLYPGLVLLDSKTPLPIGNLYDTPNTLGVDRLAVCVVANSICPNKNLLVVDMGTCITYDFVNSDNNFVGGNIAPGLDMRLKALNHYTASLPLVEKSEIVNDIGKSTQQAILAGVVKGIEFELQGYASFLTAKYGDVSIFLTGGNSSFFEKRLKFTIFANRNLLMIGLNRILNFLNA